MTIFWVMMYFTHRTPSELENTHNLFLALDAPRPWCIMYLARVGHRRQDMAMYTIRTDAVTQTIEAETIDGAATEFAAGEGVRGVTGAQSLIEAYARIGNGAWVWIEGEAEGRFGSGPDGEWYGDPDERLAADGETLDAEWDGSRYAVRSHEWYSTDGDNWTDTAGHPVEGAIFDAVTIRLVDGPRGGQVVA